MALHEQDGTWHSLCLDLALSARASSLKEAQRLLSLEIRARMMRLQSVQGATVSPVLQVPPQPLRHRLLCRVLYWLAPLRKARLYRETLPFGLVA